MRTLPRRLAPLALVGVLALSACTGDPASGTASDPASGTASSDDDAQGGQESAAPSAGATGEPTGVIGVDFPDPDDVIAEGTFTVPGTDDEVRVGIESLTVHGDTTELRLVFTPMFSAEDDGPVSVFTMLGQTVGGLDLVDRENLKEYRYGYSTDFTGAQAAQGESVGFQAFFSAPEDDVNVVDVKLQDSWPVFEDVPLTVED